jgi:hypothetical protein
MPMPKPQLGTGIGGTSSHHATLILDNIDDKSFLFSLQSNQENSEAIKIQDKTLVSTIILINCPRNTYLTIHLAKISTKTLKRIFVITKQCKKANVNQVICSPINFKVKLLQFLIREMFLLLL